MHLIDHFWTPTSALLLVAGYELVETHPPQPALRMYLPRFSEAVFHALSVSYDTLCVNFAAVGQVHLRPHLLGLH